MRYDREQARALARRMIIRAGASDAIAQSLADATVAADSHGRHGVGFAHLPDYLDAIAQGRIAPAAQPLIESPVPAAIRVDARQGIAQLGFDLAFEDFLQRARTCGVAVFMQTNSYTAGELGYYTRRLAQAGLVAFAATNGPALMTAGRAREAVYGTNPFSFAAPVDQGVPLVIDQATSATAYVNIRHAAAKGERLPEGWAIDAAGNPVTDADTALRSLLLAFGGSRGANIALMVEVLAAGVTGANWSIDCPPFSQGQASPAAGLFIAAMAPALWHPRFPARLAAQLKRLAAKGIHIPGRQPAANDIDIPESVMAWLARDAVTLAPQETPAVATDEPKR